MPRTVSASGEGRTPGFDGMPLVYQPLVALNLVAKKLVVVVLCRIMNVHTDSTAPNAPSAVQDTVRIHGHGRSIRRRGHWTTARSFVVHAGGGSVILDLRSPRIEPGDIHVALDVDRSMVKLLVPEDAVV